MVTVEVLPDDSTLSKLSHGDIHLSMRASDGSDEIIAQGTLREGSTRIAFTEPAPIGPATLARWQYFLEVVETDPEYVDPMLELWQQTNWIDACLPLRVGQDLQYLVHSNSGITHASGMIKLKDVVTYLDISF